MVWLFNKSRRTNHHSIRQSSARIGSRFARLRWNRHERVLSSIISAVCWMIGVVMSVSGRHERYGRLLGHRSLARLVSRRVRPARIVGPAPIGDLVIFNGRSYTPVTTSPAKAAKDAECDDCEEYKSDDNGDGNDDVEFVVVSRGCSSSCCGGSCGCRAGRRSCS